MLVWVATVALMIVGVILAKADTSFGITKVVSSLPGQDSIGNIVMTNDADTIILQKPT